jgi:transposase
LTRIEKVRLYPTPDQICAFNRILSACCDLYNAGLAERRGAYESWKRTKPTDFPWPTMRSQLDQFVELRKEWACS